MRPKPKKFFLLGCALFFIVLLAIRSLDLISLGISGYNNAVFTLGHSYYLRVGNLRGEQKPTLLDEVRDRSHVSPNCLYSDYVLGKTRTIHLTDDKTRHFTTGGNISCLLEGGKYSLDKCECKQGWHGDACSVPDFVDETIFRHVEKLRIRQQAPRRLVYGIPFNMEFEMLEIRFGEVGDLIDAFIILESNYTGYGQPKELYLLQKLKDGFLREHQHKIIHLYLDYFPTADNPEDGAFTDFFMKDFPGRMGLQYVKDTRPDDIYIMSDADELHRREALLFLKLHDNYPEPIGGYFRRNVFGFFWSSGITLLGFACSLRMLDVVYQNKSSAMRGATSREHRFLHQLEQFNKVSDNVQMWQMGDGKRNSNIMGWHCSWCFSPERVKVKLLSAFNYDFPRWGNYPDKTKLEYIKHLMKAGLWFDDKSQFTSQYLSLHTPYAPQYALSNFNKYFTLLINPLRPV